MKTLLAALLLTIATPALAADVWVDMEPVNYMTICVPHPNGSDLCDVREDFAACAKQAAAKAGRMSVRQKRAIYEHCADVTE